MVQESKPRVAGTWNLPGGRVEPGEGLVDAALREVREESGLEVELTGLLFVDQVLSDHDGGESRLRFVFMGEPLTRQVKTQADEHSLCAAWVARSEVAKLLLRSPTVLEMIEIGASATSLLPLSSVRARRAELVSRPAEPGVVEVVRAVSR
jgi:ADP-ribose pyrophosphatase YjhB (NUDIX family)